MAMATRTKLSSSFAHSTEPTDDIRDAIVAVRNVAKCTDCGTTGKFVLNGKNGGGYRVAQCKQCKKLYSNDTLRSLI